MKNKIFLPALMILAIHYTAQAQQKTSAGMMSYTFPPDNTADVYRILVEEYTGHTCGYGPAADNELYNNIKPLYMDTVVAVGVHAGFFAEPCPPHALPTGAPPGSYADDFRTTDGESWYGDFSIVSNPRGMVNRMDYPAATHAKPFSLWGPAIAGIIHSTPKIKIRIHTEYNTVSRQLDAYTETKFLTQLSGDYKLSVVLTEDSIVTWQYNYSASPTNDSDYVQRYVLRGSLNGTYGEQLTTAATTPSGTIFLRNYFTVLSPSYNENRIHVVAFLFNDSTKEVLNVSEDSQFVIVAGISEAASENYFTVFPNPVTSAFVLQINVPLKDAELIIYDMPGKEMMRKKFTGNRMEIGKGNLESGVYLLKVANGKRQYVRKIVVE